MVVENFVAHKYTDCSYNRLGLVVQMFLHSDHQPGKFELMENAIILDSVCTQPPEPTSCPNPFLFETMLPTPAFFTAHLPSYPSGGSVCLYDLPTSQTTWETEEQKVKEKQETDSPTSAAGKAAMSSNSKLTSFVQINKELEQQEGESLHSLLKYHEELLQQQKQLGEQAANDAEEEVICSFES
jgi:hypothetical protein